MGQEVHCLWLNCVFNFIIYRISFPGFLLTEPLHECGQTPVNQSEGEYRKENPPTLTELETVKVATMAYDVLYGLNTETENTNREKNVETENANNPGGWENIQVVRNQYSVIVYLHRTLI